MLTFTLFGGRKVEINISDENSFMYRESVPDGYVIKYRGFAEMRIERMPSQELEVIAAKHEEEARKVSKQEALSFCALLKERNEDKDQPNLDKYCRHKLYGSPIMFRSCAGAAMEHVSVEAIEKPKWEESGKINLELTHYKSPNQNYHREQRVGKFYTSVNDLESIIAGIEMAYGEENK